LYPAAVWFSAVYPNHHYVIDLIIGGFYVIAAYLIATKLVYPPFFARFIEAPAIPAKLASSPAEAVSEKPESSHSNAIMSPTR
jgi:hypothetical protein